MSGLWHHPPLEMLFLIRKRSLIFGFLVVLLFIPWVSLQFVGQFGNVVIRRALTKKLIKSPAEIVIHACALMAFWAGLYTPKLQDQLAIGMKFILLCAHRVLARQTHPAPLQLPQPMEGETRHPVQLRQLLLNEEDASDQEEEV